MKELLTSYMARYGLCQVANVTNPCWQYPSPGQSLFRSLFAISTPFQSSVGRPWIPARLVARAKSTCHKLLISQLIESHDVVSALGPSIH